MIYGCCLLQFLKNIEQSTGCFAGSKSQFCANDDVKIQQVQLIFSLGEAPFCRDRKGSATNFKLASGALRIQWRRCRIFVGRTQIISLQRTSCGTDFDRYLSDIICILNFCEYLKEIQNADRKVTNECCTPCCLNFSVRNMIPVSICIVWIS